jgi:hypothetical protein
MYLLIVFIIPLLFGIAYKSYEYFNRLSINQNMKDFVHNFVKFSLEKNEMGAFEPIDYRKLEVNPNGDSFDIDIDVFVAEKRPDKNTAQEVFVNIKGNITSDDIYKLYSFELKHSFDYNHIIPESVFQLNPIGLGWIGKFREFITSRFFKYDALPEDIHQTCTFANKQGLCSNPITKKLNPDRDFLNVVDNADYANHSNEQYYKENEKNAYHCELNIPTDTNFPTNSSLNLKCRQKFESENNPHVAYPDYEAKHDISGIMEQFKV